MDKTFWKTRDRSQVICVSYLSEALVSDIIGFWIFGFFLPDNFRNGQKNLRKWDCNQIILSSFLNLALSCLVSDTIGFT